MALSALPAVWVGGSDPHRIAEGLADALFTALRPSVLYAGLKDGASGQFAFEALRTHHRPLPRHAAGIRKHPEAFSPTGPGGGADADPQSGRRRPVAGARDPHRAGRQVGTRRRRIPDPGFPSELDRLLLGIGANQAAIAVENAWLYSKAQEEIAQRKRAEEEHRTVVSQFETVLRQMPAGVIIAEAPSGKLILETSSRPRSGGIRSWQRRRSAPIVSTKAFIPTGAPISPKNGRWPDRSSPEKSSPGRRSTFWGRRHPGTMVVHAAPIRDAAGKIIMAVATFYDITHKRKSEEELKQKTIEAEEASRLKSRFVSQVSHDLRTPLNAIMGYNRLLSAEIYGPLAEDQKQALERMHKNAEHLLKLINDVLDISKMESGRRRSISSRSIWFS